MRELDHLSLQGRNGRWSKFSLVVTHLGAFLPFLSLWKSSRGVTIPVPRAPNLHAYPACVVVLDARMSRKDVLP